MNLLDRNIGNMENPLASDESTLAVLKPQHCYSLKSQYLGRYCWSSSNRIDIDIYIAPQKSVCVN